MRHVWLCAELVKLPSMCGFYTVMVYITFAQLAPLEIPNFKSFDKLNGLTGVL